MNNAMKNAHLQLVSHTDSTDQSGQCLSAQQVLKVSARLLNQRSSNYQRFVNSVSFENDAQLSQRDLATLRVTEYFAKSLKITQDHSRSFEITLLNRACVSPY